MPCWCAGVPRKALDSDSSLLACFSFLSLSRRHAQTREKIRAKRSPLSTTQQQQCSSPKSGTQRYPLPLNLVQQLYQYSHVILPQNICNTLNFIAAKLLTLHTSHHHQATEAPCGETTRLSATPPLTDLCAPPSVVLRFNMSTRLFMFAIFSSTTLDDL